MCVFLLRLLLVFLLLFVVLVDPLLVAVAVAVVVAASRRGLPEASVSVPANKDVLAETAACILPYWVPTLPDSSDMH